MALRGSLESTLYGLIASQSQENGSIWLNRDRNLDRSRKLFTARNALNLLKDDPHLYAGAVEAYELAIEFGAHPNARSILEHLSLADERRVSLTYLQGIPSIAAVRAILACIETGLVILHICPHAFPDHKAAMAMHSGASEIRAELDQYLRDKGYLEEIESQRSYAE
jgi:hypothetical protein